MAKTLSGLAPVEVDGDGPGVRVGPVGAVHWAACGSEPLQLGGFGADQETAATENGVGPPERDQVRGEVPQRGVGVRPVEPGDLVVLARDAELLAGCSAEREQLARDGGGGGVWGDPGPADYCAAA